MPIQVDEIVQRLKAYRLGRGLTANEIADRLGISRAAVYRLEKGDIVKIETLERLAELLEVSLTSLLGVGVEYYANALAFFERMRQLEERVAHVLGNFSPISFLLLSDDYIGHLRVMLAESVGATPLPFGPTGVYIDRVIAVLEERRALAHRRRTPVVSIMGAQDIERFLHTGLIGRFGLPEAELRQRRRAAHGEVARLADIVERQPIGVQIGIVEHMPPTQTFQVFERREGSSVTLSPFRLGDQPNITSGIAMVTTAPEAIRLFNETIAQQWATAHKGAAAATLLRQIMARNPPEA
jgi:transcriptional regulator with XRE-family HTH domain